MVISYGKYIVVIVIHHYTNMVMLQWVYIIHVIGYTNDALLVNVI